MKWFREFRARQQAKRLTRNYGVWRWGFIAFFYTAWAVTPIVGWLLDAVVPWDLPLSETMPVPLGVLTIVTFGVAAAALWAAYRYALIDVAMTDTWWMSSWARRSIVAAFLVLAVGEFGFYVADHRFFRAATSVIVDLYLAWYWWTQWGDGGRGWGDDDQPILPDDPEDHGRDVPVDLVLVELPKKPVEVEVSDRRGVEGAA